MDFYLVNGAATSAYKPKAPPRSALYRNNGDGTFTDVTARAGVSAKGLFGMGVAVGDYDNDGFPDLFVLAYERCILYRNNCDGTFIDVASRAGVANLGRWASIASWFDYDQDGRLDLIIANYVDGDGTFRDVSNSSGLGLKPSNGLGLVTFDYDNDGWDDIFIANDSKPNSLFHNNHDGTFQELAYEAGLAVSSEGAPEAGMGVDAADTTGDGRMDLVVTHLDLQLARLYQSLGHGSFDGAT